VKAINIFDGGERCLAVAEEMGDGCTQIMNILLKKGKILTILKTMFPVQENHQKYLSLSLCRLISKLS
jgi:hypothetical protein